MKWKLEIEMKLLGKNGIRIEIEFFFRMEITLDMNRNYVTITLCIGNKCVRKIIKITQ